MKPPEGILFEAQTPLGFTVRVTRDYWQIITTRKHPVMAGREQDVRQTLEHPEEIRRSRSDENVYLFYRSWRIGRWVCAVSKQTGSTGLPHHHLSYRSYQRRRKNMAELSVYHDPVGRTLTVWFDSPQSEYSCEETGEEIVLMKDRAGRVVGFEKLNYPGDRSEAVRFSYEQVGQLP